MEAKVKTMKQIRHSLTARSDKESDIIYNSNNEDLEKQKERLASLNENACHFLWPMAYQTARGSTLLFLLVTPFSIIQSST